MPTIRSKKYPDNHQFVDAQTWEDMKLKGLARRFVIVDDGDIADTVAGTPEQIIDFQSPGVIEDQAIEKILSREEIKAELDKLEVEYNTRAATDTLLNLLNENK